MNNKKCYSQNSEFYEAKKKKKSDNTITLKNAKYFYLHLNKSKFVTLRYKILYQGTKRDCIVGSTARYYAAIILVLLFNK